VLSRDEKRGLFGARELTSFHRRPVKLSAHRDASAQLAPGVSRPGGDGGFARAMPDETPNAARPTLRLKLAPAPAPASFSVAAKSAKPEPVKPEMPAPVLPVQQPPEPRQKGPATTPRKVRSYAKLEAAIASLREAWPLAFVFPVRPLAIGAGRAILDAKPPGVGRRAIKRALEHYASNDAYLAAVRDGVHRVALDGSDAGEPNEANRAYARQRLEKRSAAAKETPS
jgi:hypothetical protein